MQLHTKVHENHHQDLGLHSQFDRMRVMEKALISVIIPSYNRAAILERAIRSVLDQQGPPFEIIVVDDGSTDETEKLVHQLFRAAGNMRPLPLKFISQENRGVSAARNTGITNAQGEWLAFLDSDDEWLPGKLEAQMRFFEENPDYQICQTEEVWIRRGIRVNPMKKHMKKGGWIFELCLPLCVVSPSATMMHRSVFDVVGLFREDYPACEDYELWLRVAARYPIGLITEPYIKKYGGHEDQLSRQFEAMDRFRVKALDEVIRSGILTAAQTQAAQAVLEEKLTILKMGAEKRGETLPEIKQLVEKMNSPNRNL